LVFERSVFGSERFGRNLIKNISELEVRALPQNLPHEIKVSIDTLSTFADRILVKDLILPNNVKVSVKPDEIVVSVAEPSKVEESWQKKLKKKLRMSRR